MGLLLIGFFVSLNCNQPDTTAPTIISTIPETNATDVVINTNIVITFSESMDTASVQAAFTIDPQAPGDFRWTGDSVLTYDPTSSLDSNTIYTVTVATAAQDRAGNNLTANYSTSFTTGTQVSSGTIYMLGRSVTYNWFQHWGWDWDDSHPVVHGRFNLYHREIVGPDDGGQVTVDTVRQIINAIPASQTPVIFFKLCFVDFYGGSQDEANTNLERNKSVVDSVYSIVVNQYGYKLIIGNALPRLASETDSFLVWNHEQYNLYLESLHTQHSTEVLVFDLYSVLTNTTTGGIKSEYAAAADDAHPNDAAYVALDTPFFNFLEVNF